MNYFDSTKPILQDSIFAKQSLIRGTNILVYMTGSLGDTLAAVPALWAVREHFRDASITILSDSQVDGGRVLPRPSCEAAVL